MLLYLYRGLWVRPRPLMFTYRVLAFLNLFFMSFSLTVKSFCLSGRFGQISDHVFHFTNLTSRSAHYLTSATTVVSDSAVYVPRVFFPGDLKTAYFSFINIIKAHIFFKQKDRSFLNIHSFLAINLFYCEAFSLLCRRPSSSRDRQHLCRGLTVFLFSREESTLWSSCWWCLPSMGVFSTSRPRWFTLHSSFRQVPPALSLQQTNQKICVFSQMEPVLYGFQTSCRVGLLSILKCL